MKSKDNPKERTGLLFRYSLQSFAVILLLAVLIRTFVVSSFVMSGAGMLPTVWPGDFLLGSKIRLHGVLRGEVVAMRCPLVRDKLCMKRVVGVPGDRIEFRGDTFVLNGQPARQIPAGAFATEVVGGHSRSIWPATSNVPEPGPIVIPPQYVYLMNDKRSDRDDSRAWGPVSQELLEAKIVRVWMSLDWFEGENVRTWPRIRWERLLRSID